MATWCILYATVLDRCFGIVIKAIYESMHASLLLCLHKHARTHAHTHRGNGITNAHHATIICKAPEVTSDMAGLSGSDLLDNSEFKEINRHQLNEEGKARLRELYDTLMTQMIRGNWVRIF